MMEVDPDRVALKTSMPSSNKPMMMNRSPPEMAQVPDDGKLRLNMGGMSCVLMSLMSIMML